MKEEPGVAGAKSPKVWVQRPACEGGGLTGDQEVRVPANLLRVDWRQEHLWQLPPRPL